VESKAKVFGHAVHPMLIVFPLGLLPTSLVLDIMTLVTNDPKWAQFSFWLIGAGIVTGLAAAVFGLIDWLAIPAGTRAKSLGAVHGLGNVVVVGLFVVGWFLRRPDPGDPGTIALGLSFAGIALALVTGWMGGELVERMGVGVDAGAHLNSSNSLSGKPATESAPPGRSDRDRPAIV
jgi:uncharacterized membrane protein